MGFETKPFLFFFPSHPRTFQYLISFNFRRKDASFSKWRSAEESRRMAVEEALDELLARDTQYRKELNAHLEKRMAVAEWKRKSREEEFKEVDYDEPNMN